MSPWLNSLERLVGDATGVEEVAHWATFQLEANPRLLAHIYDQLAGQTGNLDNLAKFQKRFQSKVAPPVPPDPKDKGLVPSRRWTSASPEARQREQIAWKQYHYLKAQHQYEKDTKTFTQEAEQHRYIVSTYPNSLRGYVDYMGSALSLADQAGQSGDPQNFFLPSHDQYLFVKVTVGYIPI